MKDFQFTRKGAQWEVRPDTPQAQAYQPETLLLSPSEAFALLDRLRAAGFTCSPRITH